MKSVGLADGEDGKDGTAGQFDLGIAMDSDGIYYWTLNGEWILDESGNRMPAQPKDGKNGANGKDDVDLNLPVPKFRINPDTNMWEISTDNGATYKSTGIPANGKDGKNGQNGKKGQDDNILTVTLSTDGQHVIITLLDGTQFVIPITGQNFSV